VQFVPTPAERDGDFSAVSKSLVNPISGQALPDNQIPASLLSPVSQYFLNDIPLPNGPGGQLTFTGALVRQTEEPDQRQLLLHQFQRAPGPGGNQHPCGRQHG
jgi:hypothetical protein